jgi:hypothetical protein
MARQSRSTIVRHESKRTRGHTGAHGDRQVRRTRAGLPAPIVWEA